MPTLSSLYSGPSLASLCDPIPAVIVVVIEHGVEV